MSRSLDSLKQLNSEHLKDGELQIRLRSYLPQELAALRQPNAEPEPAMRVLQKKITEIRFSALSVP